MKLALTAAVKRAVGRGQRVVTGEVDIATRERRHTGDRGPAGSAGARQASRRPAVVSANVTVLVLPVTVLPPRSCTATTGWVAERDATVAADSAAW